MESSVAAAAGSTHSHQRRRHHAPRCALQLPGFQKRRPHHSRYHLIGAAFQFEKYYIINIITIYIYIYTVHIYIYVYALYIYICVCVSPQTLQAASFFRSASELLCLRLTAAYIHEANARRKGYVLPWNSTEAKAFWTLSLRRRGRAGGGNEKGPRSMGAGQASEVREQAGKARRCRQSRR